jgi:hypothetical protein
VYVPLVDPRTFLPARRLELASVPTPGETARPLPLELEPGRPAVVAFLRHTGCPFAEATMRALQSAAAGAPDVRWVAISHAPEQATAAWGDAVGGTGMRNRHPRGTRWQSAGTFALGPDGIVRWRHLPSHAGDLPDLTAAVEAIR